MPESMRVMAALQGPAGFNGKAGGAQVQLEPELTFPPTFAQKKTLLKLSSEKKRKMIIE